MIIYLAGPLFTIAERNFNKQLSQEISKNFEKVQIVLPQEEAKKIMKIEKPFQIMFDFCIKSILKADIIIAILDGPDVDSGTSFEIGYAFALNKPVIGVRTDFRKSEEKGVNLMLSRSMTKMINVSNQDISLSKLGNKISRILKSLDI